jgi:hypothetical protein
MDGASVFGPYRKNGKEGGVDRLKERRAQSGNSP